MSNSHGLALQNTVIVCVTAVALAILSYILLQTRPVYMVDFSVYLPPDE